jgi:transposase-like protein/IS1 family transposase
MTESRFADLACPNPECPAYGQRGGDNLRLHGWSGRGHRIRCLHCVPCGTDFSERANTPLWGLRLPEDKLVAIAEHLANGVACRATARLCGVGLNTVLRFTQRFGKHAEGFHDLKVRGIEPRQIQPDEAWAFVGKKDKNGKPLDPKDAEQGSYWDHVIYDSDSKLIVSLVVGRRNADTVVQVFTDFYERTNGCLPELITTDEYAVYETVILDTYGVWKEELELTTQEAEEYDEVGMPEFYFPEEIAYATVHKERQGNRVVGVTSKVVLGTVEQVEESLANSEQSQTVNTSLVERYHGTQRQFNARKKRKAYTFSKELSFHAAGTWLVVLWYNFGWTVRTLRQKIQDDPPRYHHRTPAMAAGLTDHPWTMAELLSYPLYPSLEPPSNPRTYQQVLERLKGVDAAALGPGGSFT